MVVMNLCCKAILCLSRVDVCAALSDMELKVLSLPITSKQMLANFSEI